MSIFSESKKQTISDNLELHSLFINLEDCLKSTKDISEIDFGDTLEMKKNSLSTLRNEISKVQNGFKDIILSEFDSFRLHSVLNTRESNKCFETIISAINDSINSKDFKSILQSIQTIFKNYLVEVNSLFRILGKYLTESKDIRLHYLFEASFAENKGLLGEINEKIELIKSEFDFKIQNEFSMGLHIPLFDEKMPFLKYPSLIDPPRSCRINLSLYCGGNYR